MTKGMEVKQKMEENRNPSMFHTMVAKSSNRFVDYCMREESLINFIGRILALLCTFILVDYFVRHASLIGANSLAQPILFIEVIKQLGVVGVLGLALMFGLLIRYGGLLNDWTSLDSGIYFRNFVVLLSVLMAWAFGFYEFNFYFNQGHYWDRTLIVVLVPLIYFRPVFIFPFLLLAYTLMWQLGEPAIGSGTIFAHKLQVLQVLNLFAAGFLLHALTGVRQTRDILFFICCLVAAAYWIPAMTKWSLDWLTYGHLYHMPLAAYAHGWLAFLSPETIVDYAKVFVVFDKPMLAVVLFFETASLLFLWRRKFSIAILLVAIVFHTAVFAMYGFLFWTWIILNLLLVLLLFYVRHASSMNIYQSKYFVASVFLIGFGSLWCHPARLAWLDTKLSYTYQYEAVGKSGKHYTLSPQFFGPYQSLMTMANFSYLIEDFGPLVGPYGVTSNRLLADKLVPLKSAEEVLSLESGFAKSRYNAERAQHFQQFIKRYIQNRVNNESRGEIIHKLSPPPQFWSFARGEEYQDQEPIKKVVISSITTLYDGKQLEIIRTKVLSTINI